ncbi:hypothetical protein [Sanguibacter suaedae]|uniref:Uncharacterized protein n=1 Tax=Sanguibacter suaedae TaxID=2795737 RepID=A0A934M5S9_9MICO|nr:hypothetical protein [Sanguibacter suaedae]MBI9113442.1 hypothetical protein [Sanguibacter suaedae]
MQMPLLAPAPRRRAATRALVRHPRMIPYTSVPFGLLIMGFGVAFASSATVPGTVLVSWGWISMGLSPFMSGILLALRLPSPPSPRVRRVDGAGVTEIRESPLLLVELSLNAVGLGLGFLGGALLAAEAAHQAGTITLAVICATLLLGTGLLVLSPGRQNFVRLSRTGVDLSREGQRMSFAWHDLLDVTPIVGPEHVYLTLAQNAVMHRSHAPYLDFPQSDELREPGPHLIADSATTRDMWLDGLTLAKVIAHYARSRDARLELGTSASLATIERIRAQALIDDGTIPGTHSAYLT